MTHRNELGFVDGTPIYINPDIPKGQSFLIQGSVYVNQSDYWTMLYGRPPLWTRHMLGVREAERDRRKFR